MPHRRRILRVKNWAVIWGTAAISVPSHAKRSTKSQAAAVSATEAHRRLKYHCAMAKEYCPSSSTVARHFGCDAAVERRRFCAPLLSARDLALQA
jgi:hypothetical protein